MMDAMLRTISRMLIGGTVGAAGVLTITAHEQSWLAVMVGFVTVLTAGRIATEDWPGKSGEPGE